MPYIKPMQQAFSGNAMSVAPASAVAVANTFLDFGRQESGCPAIDQMKLQKLLYYAHAWHLAIKGSPLFDQDFEAWPWGPVVRDVYSQTVKFGRAAISEDLVELRGTGDNMLNYRFVAPRVEDKELLEFLRAVWEVHKRYTGIQLSNSTHAPTEPWAILKEQYGSLETKPTIPNQLIAEVFKKKLNARNSAA